MQLVPRNGNSNNNVIPIIEVSAPESNPQLLQLVSDSSRSFVANNDFMDTRETQSVSDAVPSTSTTDFIIVRSENSLYSVQPMSSGDEIIEPYEGSEPENQQKSPLNQSEHGKFKF